MVRTFIRGRRLTYRIQMHVRRDLAAAGAARRGPRC
eukprot:SAG31_NODE_12626_length_928_cov_4.898673_2_plen_35_part_01